MTESKTRFFSNLYSTPEKEINNKTHGVTELVNITELLKNSILPKTESENKGNKICSIYAVLYQTACMLRLTEFLNRHNN